MRLLVGVAALMAAVCAGPTSAVPSADHLAGAEATVLIAGAGGVELFVGVAARVSEAGTRLGTGDVTVSLRQCRSSRCDPASRYRSPIGRGDLVVAPDRSGATLRIALFGQPLERTWHTPSDETSVDGEAELYDPVLPTGQVRAWVNQTRDTEVTATLLGLRCSGRAGFVYTQQLVDGVPQAASPPLPTSMPRQLSALRRPTCR